LHLNAATLIDLCGPAAWLRQEPPENSLGRRVQSEELQANSEAALTTDQHAVGNLGQCFKCSTSVWTNGQTDVKRQHSADVRADVSDDGYTTIAYVQGASRNLLTARQEQRAFSTKGVSIVGSTIRA
jgi:hypothetical protein